MAGLGFDDKQLRATATLLKGMDRPVSREVRKHTRKHLAPIWRQELAEHASTRLEHRVLVQGSSVRLTNFGGVLRAATGARKLRGGGTVRQLAAGAEFGSSTRKNFRPRNRSGYVVYPAFRAASGRIARLWVQTVVRTFHEEISRG